MNLFQTIREHVVAALKELDLPEGINVSAVTAELPRDPSHGDVSTNAAMVVAKPAGKNPREIAEQLAEKLRLIPTIAQVDIAGPGFINMRLDKCLWYDLVLHILEEGISYGNSTIGGNKKTNLEFVSANPTGPMHIGHARGAVFGDVLGRLLSKAGYDITREYYINDAGAQIEVLAKSALLRYKEACGEDIGAIPEGLYPGSYLIDVGQQLKEQLGDSLLEKSDEEAVEVLKPLAIEAMIELIKGDLHALGVDHDVFTSEKALHDQKLVEKALNVLKGKNLVYEGILEPPKGKKPDDWEEREQTLFKATEFGDDVDRPLIKSDGSWTYFASDLAYHLDKMNRGFNHMILELGVDHGGYLKRMKAAIAALSDNKATIDIKFHALVNFMDNGEPVKMSKRAGNFTTVRDVIDQVDKDIIRFMMLTRKNDAVLDFDLTKVKEQSKDNPVFYVQYAHARIHSVLRHAKERAPDALALLKTPTENLLESLTDDAEVNIIKKLAAWPNIVESAAQTLEPHRITFYLQELAAEFHALWNKGKEDTTLQFILERDMQVTAARLAMIQAVAIVIASGLDIINVKPVTEMH